MLLLLLLLLLWLKLPILISKALLKEMAARAGSDLAHFTGLGSEREGAEKGQQGREEKQKGKRG